MPFRLKTVQLGPRKAGIPWLSSCPQPHRVGSPQHGPGKALDQQALHGDQSTTGGYESTPRKEQERQTEHTYQAGLSARGGLVLRFGEPRKRKAGLQKSQPTAPSYFSGHALLILEVLLLPHIYGNCSRSPQTAQLGCFCGKSDL